MVETKATLTARVRDLEEKVTSLEETLDLGLSLSHLEGVLLGQLEHLLLKVTGNRRLLCRLIARAESLYHLLVLPV